MPNPDGSKIVLPVLDLSSTALRTGPEGGDMALDSNDSRELKYNQSGTTRTVANLTGTQTLTNKTLTSPTITAPTITGASSIVRTAQSYNWSRAKVGASAGWVLGGADNLPYVATMAASQTGGTLVVPLDNLKIGDTITGYTINAQVESAGGAVTIDAALRAVTNVAADPTDAAIGTGMTQVSVTADTAVSQSKTGHTEVVAVGKSYYLLITATTAASTDIILQHGQVTVTTS